MSPLNVLLTVGSNVTVNIAKINLHNYCSLVEFGGNFNHGQLAREIYRQMKKEIQIPKERECDFEGNTGDVCLVEDDKTWHRARIITRCLDKYYVFLIDDGRTLWVSKGFLAWGESSFFDLPPMMEMFILGDVLLLSVENRWSATALELFKTFQGKTVTGRVQDVMMPYRVILLDIPDVFRQMNELGFARKIPSEKFKVLVSHYLHSPRDIVSQASPGVSLTNVQAWHASKNEKYLYPELLPGTIETVEVTHVLHPLNFFCKLHVFSQELKKMNEQIHEFYEDTSADIVSGLQYEGSPCATKGSDGKWYRSVLQQNVVSDIVKVFHVDYGMGDFVKVENIRQLSAKFFRLPVVTYACSLYGIMDKGIGWTTGQINLLRSILLNKVFACKFEHQSFSRGVYYVTLYGNENANINIDFGIQEQCLTTSERAYFDGAFQTQSQKTHKDLSDHRCVPVICSLNSCAFSHGSTADEMSCTAKTKSNTDEAFIGEDIYRGLQAGCSYQSKPESALDEYLFTIGSLVEVNVSHIENDQRFWCQMADNASNLKMLMHSIQSHYLCSQFQWPTGSVCVVRHPDNGMWYRARILTRGLTSYIEVRLIDYGQEVQVPLQDLRLIDPKFLKLKCQAFQCSLFNRMNTESHALNHGVLSKLFRFIDPDSFSSVSLRCTIRGVMYDSQGMVLNMVDIDSPSFDQKQLGISTVKSIAEPFVPTRTYAVIDDLEVGAKKEIWITCVKGVNHFYGQLKENAAMVEKMTKDIQQFCDVVQHARYKFSPQMLCLARYNNGEWHRGQIRAISPQIIVHFVDYGDVLALDNSNVLPFPAQPSKSMSIPFQAIHFSLFNVTLVESCELNNWFDDYVTDLIFTAIVVRKNPSGRLSVELHDGQKNVNMAVKEKWKKIQKKDQRVTEEVNMSSHEVQKPLWIQDYFNSKLQVCKDLNRNGRKSHDHIIAVGKDKIDKHTGEAVCADELCASQELPKEMDRQKNGIYAKLTDLPSRVLKAGFVSEVYVSHCNSPSSFFVQISSEENDIFCIGEKLNCSQMCDSQIDFQHLQPGDLVKAEYHLDGAWYRAVVQNKLEDGTVQVEFIDFGNETTLSVLKVRQLGSQFLYFPRYSVHCSLIVGDGEKKRKWTQEEIVKFKNGALTDGLKKVLCSFIKEDDSVWQVKIEDQGIMLSEALVETECSVQLNPHSLISEDIRPGRYKNPLISIGQTIQAYASSVVGPDYFWCQYADSEILDEISVMAQETGNSANTNPIERDCISPGDPCLALFPDDNMWYRAQVINKLTNSVCVLFVDYGNECEIKQSTVRAITPSLMETPPQAFLCQLEWFSSTDGSWNNAAAARLFDLLSDKPLKVRIQKVQLMSVCPNFPQYHVQVESNMVLINNIMRDYWNCSVTQVCEQITQGGFLTSTENKKTACIEWQEVANFEACKEGGPQSYSTVCADTMTSPCKVTAPIPHAIGHEAIQNVSQLETDFHLFDQSESDRSESECVVSFTNQYEVKKNSDTVSPAFIKSKLNTQIGFEPSTPCLPKLSDLPAVTIEQDFISEVYVSHINSPLSFYLQLVKDENCLMSLTEKLNSTLSVNDQVPFNSIQCGSLVKAVFPDDDSWYRALVKDSNGKDIVHVEFIDFGNEVTISTQDVRQLDEQFLEFPRMSIHCCFNKEDCDQMLNGMEQEKCPLRKILGEVGGKKFCKFTKKHDTVWEVKMADRRNTFDHSICGLSLEKWDDLDFSDPRNASPKEVLSDVTMSTAVSLPFKKPKLPMGQTIEAYASFIVGPNYFFCQYANSEELAKISLTAQESGNRMETNLIQRDQLCPGDPCIALFSDKMWYRAEVLRKSPGSLSVVFVDYGNKSEIESEYVKPLPSCLLKSPLQAFLCQLEGFNLSDGFWSNNATDAFRKLIVDKPLNVTIQQIENHKESLTPPFYVRIQSQECVINEQMKSFWNASVRINQSTEKDSSNINSLPLPSEVQYTSENGVGILPVEKTRSPNDLRPPSASSLEGEEETFSQDGQLMEKSSRSYGTWSNKNCQNSHMFEKKEVACTRGPDPECDTQQSLDVLNYTVINHNTDFEKKKPTVEDMDCKAILSECSSSGTS